MAAFRSVYAEYYDNGLKYEFITEIAPNVWKISRKSDRMDYLAHDVTDMLFADVNSNPQKLTDYGRLLAPDGENMIENVKAVLNHPNLVCLVDCFALQFSDSGKLGREQWFAVWDYCDAGNLGNLLLPPQPHPQDPAPSVQHGNGDGDIEMEDASREAGEWAAAKFLPESLCWHVLTSLLRAITWLHDGVYDVVQGEDGRWKMIDEGAEWLPMLHRNITPQNVFIGYPRRREWYGPVKLGNYGRLFISGHCQDAGLQHAPTLSKAIGPHPRHWAPLEELATLDFQHGSIYPYQIAQPYTFVSEYRAVGEIIQAMMIEPIGGNHMERIRSQPAQANLQNAKYTGRLKNFVVKLMENDPWQNVAGAANPTYVTSDLYREAQQGLRWFIRSGSGKDEADAFVTSRMAEVEDYVENTALKDTQLFDSFQNVQEILEQFSKAA
ncbi:hypothetical protein F5Y14DRAFT_64099 [Nemania sp. NC0429]|nr:hypothetical protein F5Y14DRAFT_64099 [Nemania sp. NC0429]